MLFKECLQNDIKLLLGDFNAKIGVENEFKPVIGGHSLHSVANENGIRLIDFTIEQYLVIRSTLLLGDFNAKIGVENEFKPVIGGHSLHSVANENGIRLIDFAIEQYLVIRSTMFPHKNVHKMTWWSPDNKPLTRLTIS